MDNRKLSTAEVLFSGMLDKPEVKSKCPGGMDLTSVDYYPTDQSLLDGLEANGLSASMYYGVWKIWRTENTYAGELLQYGSISEEFVNSTLEEAFEKAKKWATLNGY